jgi:hypothetical protein
VTGALRLLFVLLAAHAWPAVPAREAALPAQVLPAPAHSESFAAAPERDSAIAAPPVRASVPVAKPSAPVADVPPAGGLPVTLRLAAAPRRWTAPAARARALAFPYFATAPPLGA